MPLLWLRRASRAWEPVSLAERCYTLAGGDARPLAPGEQPGRSKISTFLFRAGAAPGRWLLVAHPGAEHRVNGAPVTLGLRVLADRDEIGIGDAGSLFFSAESISTVAPFSHSRAGEGRCARCLAPIADGAPVVVCGGCGVTHHEECWGYAERCASCPRSTDSATGVLWRPEED